MNPTSSSSPAASPTPPPSATPKREVPQEMRASSDQAPTMGRTVIYSDRRTLDARPCPAVVTAVRSTGPEAVLALTSFPCGMAPFPVDGVKHVSQAGDAEPCWGWPVLSK